MKLPNKKLLVFLDIDGTLIKPNQKPNSNKLPAIIREMSKREMLFGLNSNRSFHDVKNIYQQFRLNGPIILENGVYFRKSITDPRIFLIKSPLKLRKIARKAVKAFIKKYKIDCDFFFGDTVKFIKSRKIKTVSSAILVNGFREYTGSVHAYNYGKRDLKLAKKLTKFLKNYFKENKLDLLVEYTKSFGNVIFWPRGTDKQKALHRIKKYYPNYDLVMIGDDLADIEALKEVKYFFAVGNAQDQVKAKADFVAKQNYTKGVIEILRYFKNNFLHKNAKRL